MSHPKEKILLLMSGGVDSSVSALLLKETYEVIGVTMKIPDTQAHVLARRIAEHLGIFHMTIESEAIFTEQVINKFINSRKLGMTPNPCADCNKALKFNIIPRIAEEKLGMSNLRIASGHYVLIREIEEHKYICRSKDTEKDQSYFLCDLPASVVQRLLFPLSILNKREVRDIARKANIEAAESPESMDMCFSVPNEVLNINARGDIVGIDGRIIGEHNGIINYTIGQRKGLGIAAKEPLYILGINAAQNIIIAGSKTDSFKKNVYAINTNNLSNKSLDCLTGIELFGKTRSRGEPSPCKVTEISCEKFSVEFDEPQFAPTPGQRLVCYDVNGVMLLSGVIRNAT